MIRYALTCANDHGFESWFQSAEAFERLAEAKMISCTTCGSQEIAKTLMAPSVRPARKAARVPSLTTPESPEEKAIAAMRKHIAENSDYVGMNFAAEARAIHEGAAPERAIHGEARMDEARQLIEDGVPVAPLPFLPSRKTN